MRVKDFKGTVAAGTSASSILAFATIAGETDLTVNLVLVNVALLPAAGHFRLVQMVNISTAGQRIRVGGAPAFGPPGVGTLLLPGQGVSWVIGQLASGINAIADVAGGLLNVEVMDT